MTASPAPTPAAPEPVPDAAAAMVAWARGDYSTQAAVAITLNSSIRHLFIDDTEAPTSWVDWSGHFARPRWGEYLAANRGMSSGERFLVALCENIAHGPEDAPGLNLGGLWNLDPRNRGAVLDALNANLDATR